MSFSPRRILPRLFPALGLAAAAWSPPALGQDPAATAWVEPDVPVCRPPITPKRHEEDWSCLRAASGGDYADPLKFIALGDDGLVHLSLGLSARLDYEFYADEFWGAGEDDTHALLQRYLVHGDLNLTPFFRVFAQLAASLEDGRDGGPRPIDEDQLELAQLFAQGTLPLGDRAGVHIRVGRQEIDLGLGRMVSIREGPNVRQVHDAVTLRARLASTQVELIGALPILARQGVFDNERDGQFWGIALAQGLLPGLSADAYYLGRLNDARSPAGPLRNERHTLGARVFGQVEGLGYDLEGALQLGRSEVPGGAELDVRAFAVEVMLAYTFRELWSMPTLRMDGGVISGDRRATAELDRFEPPFPRGSYFGQIGAIGPANSAGFRVLARLEPLPRLFAVQVYSYFFWRTSPGDGVYGVPGNPLRPDVGDERFVGVQPELELVLTPDAHLTFIAQYARFLAGPFLDDAGPGQDIDYLLGRAQYAF